MLYPTHTIELPKHYLSFTIQKELLSVFSFQILFKDGKTDHFYWSDIPENELSPAYDPTNGHHSDVIIAFRRLRDALLLPEWVYQ